MTGSYVNSESKCFSAAIRPDLSISGGQIAQQAGGMAVVPDVGESLSPEAADLVRRVARVFLDEPADLMAEVHAAVSAAADEPLRSEPVLAAEVAASTRANVLHLAASMLKDPGGPVRPTCPPRCSASRAKRSAAGSSRTCTRPTTPGRTSCGRTGCAPRSRCHRTRRRLHGWAVVAASVVATVWDMVTPLFSREQGIIGARWLRPRGPHGGFALHLGMYWASFCRCAYSSAHLLWQNAIPAATSSRSDRARLAAADPGPVAKRLGACARSWATGWS